MRGERSFTYTGDIFDGVEDGFEARGERPVVRLDRVLAEVG